MSEPEPSAAPVPAPTGPSFTYDPLPPRTLEFPTAPQSGSFAPRPVIVAIPPFEPKPDQEPARARTRTGLFVVVIAAMIGAVAGGGAVALVNRDDSNSANGMDIRAVLDKVEPSVVSIEVEGRDSQGVFGAAGSGLVISSDGLVLTNAHVLVGGTGDTTVIFHDGARKTAQLVGSFPDEDIALVKVEPDEPLVAADLGVSDDVHVGDEVVAIGNALDLGSQPSVTRGIVSATDRTIDDIDIHLSDLIQTDAAINPGNSGGPLVDAHGKVVGINTAILQDAQNIGFSIAIDPVKPLIEDLKAGKGEITPDTAFLGVSSRDVADVEPDVLDQYGVTSDDGAFIVDVSPDTAADKAGLQAGDVILEIDGERVSDSGDVRDIVRSHKPDDKIELRIERDGEEMTVTATLGSVSD